MKNVVADKWYIDRIFLIGDASHQYPPSGGYGLNTGIKDAFSLAWVLKYILGKDNDKRNENILKNNFESERIIHSTFVSKCARLNYEKFLNSCRALGLNIQHMNILETVVKNVIPNSIQRPIFNRLINTGIYLNHLINSKNLRNHLKNRNNHIQLIFPYLDYQMNFKNETKNEIAKFESVIDINKIDLSFGMIIPNYLIGNKNKRLRQFIKEIQDKSEHPLFFVFLRKDKLSELKFIKLFNNQINLDFFKYEIIYLNKSSEIHDCVMNQKIYVDINELKNIDILVVRPDFIIEYVS